MVLWLLAGAVIGWACVRLIGINAQHGTLISIIIGMVGALLGGQMVAPMISSSPIVSGDFNIHALFIAAVTAAACLAIANMIENRFGV